MRKRCTVSEDSVNVGRFWHVRSMYARRESNGIFCRQYNASRDSRQAADKSNMRTVHFRAMGLTLDKKLTTHLKVCVLYDTPEVLDDRNAWRSTRVEACKRVRSEHDLVIVLAQQIEHVRDQDDKCVSRAVDESPRQFWELAG